MAKNEAITITYTAWDTAANEPKTGDVANHTVRYLADGVADSPAAEPAEVERGEYKIVIAADENTGDMMAVIGTSSTDNVVIVKASWQNADRNAIASTVKTTMEGAGSHLALVLADTGELQTDWADGGRLDMLLDTAVGGGDATAANQTAIIDHLIDIKGTGFAADTHSLPQCLTASLASLAVYTVTVETTTIGEAAEVNIIQYQHAAFASTSITADESQAGDSHTLVVYEPDGTAALWQLTTGNGQISVGGSGNRTITISADDTNMGTAGVFRYALRNTTDDVVVCEGSLTIKAMPDSS